MTHSFADYIFKTKQHIAEARTDLKENAVTIIEANAPFELYPSVKNPKIGALLIHGLFDSPFIMRDIGTQLQQAGMLVRAILLPGHGTKPADLQNIKMEDWLETVKFGIATLVQEVETIYLVGFSTGAALALYAVLTKLCPQANIAKLILISPAIQIRSKFGFATNWHHLLSWKWQRASWLHIAEENDYARYQSAPFNAAYQIYRLTKAIGNLNTVTPCPFFIILTLADTTISTKSAIQYFHDHESIQNRLLIYAKNIGEHPEAPNIIFHSSIYSDLHIQDFSHVCLPIAPDNPHYGQQGDYIFASRIKNNNDVTYRALNRFEINYYELLHRLGLTKNEYQRLTYNPDFAFMMQEILQFLIS